MTKARCSFAVRIPEGDGSRYEHVNVKGPSGSTYLPTDLPPLVGDLIHLWGDTDETRGTFEVVARQWLYPSWGSYDWPHDEPEPQVGPLLDIVVIPADGPFLDEVATDEDE